MKKTYETPSAEKIAFNYRDQVVAASGEEVQNGTSTTSGFGVCYDYSDFLEYLFTQLYVCRLIQ